MIKIGYFGTPSHSAKLLEMLCDAGYNISFVVCNPDKPAGRKKLLTPPPVKEMALAKGIPVFQFASIRQPEAAATINGFHADVYIIFAYGKLIPEEIFNFPSMGTINLHGSLLPDLRGASPVQTAILKNYSKTGITLQYIVKELDAGNIICKSEIQMETSDTTESLFAKMTQIGFSELHKLMQSVKPNEKFLSTPQDHTKATFCQKLSPEDRIIHFTENAIDVHNRIRAFVPPPYAWCTFQGKRLNLIQSVFSENQEKSGRPGELKIVDKKQLWVNCGDRPLLLEMLQPESKKAMTAAEFINGYRLKDGDILA